MIPEQQQEADARNEIRHDGYNNFRHGQGQDIPGREGNRGMPSGLNVRKKNSLKTVGAAVAGLAVTAMIVFSLIGWAGQSGEEAKPKNELLDGSAGGKNFKGEKDEMTEHDREEAEAASAAAAEAAAEESASQAGAGQPETQAASDPYAAILERKLHGDVLVAADGRQSGEPDGSGGTDTDADTGAATAAIPAPPADGLPLVPDSVGEGNIPGGAPSGSLSARLTGGSYPATAAARQPDRDYLLARGTAIPCVTVSKIVTDFPGLTRCLVTRDVYSANGKTVLVARGSTITGEQTAALVQGQTRVFALWSDLRTPDGLAVRLDSPGADPLGASGHPARVNHHFWKRIGGAVLVSLIDDAVNRPLAKIFIPSH